MTDLHTAAKQALEALEYWDVHGKLHQPTEEAITALRQALEQPAQDSDDLTIAYMAGLHDGKKSVQPAQQEPAAWESIEALATARYKVVPSHDSMFYRHAVVAGDGTQQLYLGREVECENMARKFAGAFLDGAFLMRDTRPQAREPEQPALTDHEGRPLKFWGGKAGQPTPPIEAAHTPKGDA